MPSAGFAAGLALKHCKSLFLFYSKMNPTQVLFKPKVCSSLVNIYCHGNKEGAKWTQLRARGAGAVPAAAGWSPPVVGSHSRALPEGKWTWRHRRGSSAGFCGRGEELHPALRTSQEPREDHEGLSAQYTCAGNHPNADLRLRALPSRSFSCTRAPSRDFSRFTLLWESTFLTKHLWNQSKQPDSCQCCRLTPSEQHQPNGMPQDVLSNATLHYIAISGEIAKLQGLNIHPEKSLLRRKKGIPC